MSKFLAIAHALKENGWTVTALQLESDCWWAKEIWHLRSEWSPQGQELFLSLLLDPVAAYDPNRSSDSDVWAVALSKEKPTTRPLSGIQVARKLKERVAEIVTSANSMRFQDEVTQPQNPMK